MKVDLSITEFLDFVPGIPQLFHGDSEDSCTLFWKGAPHSMRMLIAEDDRALGSLLVRTFQDEGFTVAWAQDGEAALIEWRRTQYGLRARFKPSATGWY